MPLNATLPSRLFHAKLGSTEADVAVINHASNAVPTGKRYIVLTITVVNNGTADRTVLLRFVPSGETSAAEHNVLSGQAATLIPAGDTKVFDGRWALHAGDKVRGAGGAANEVTVRGDGIIVDV
jgi:hypothetical protein